jgi:Ca2+/Na+ antiporter
MVNQRNDWTLATLAALLVLFSAMLDAQVSMVLAVVCLVALAAYMFIRGHKQA